MWHARLNLEYARREAPVAQTVLSFRHEGPLRVLQSLYPEGERICHNVLVHPPGGLVGGDALEIQAHLAAGTHALVTTPGATRFYRSQKGLAQQTIRVHLETDARLEWLPLETIAYPDCDGLNQAIFQLDPGAEMMAWDLTALGLPGANQPYTRGKFLQHLEIEGVWRERGRLDAEDTALLASPLGLAGYRCMGTLVLAAGTAWHPSQRDALLEAARDCIAEQEDAEAGIAGVTAAHGQVLVLRTLSHWVEPSQRLLRAVWAAWRERAWAIPAQAPRLWAL